MTTKPTDKEQYLNIADQCAATATSDLAASILVDGGNGTLRQLLNDAADAIRANWDKPGVVGEPYGYVYTVQAAPIVGDELKLERTVFTHNKPSCAAIALYTTPQTTGTTDSALEDAARYRWLREGNDAKHGAARHIAVNLYGCEWDAAIDAARKQGGHHGL